VRRRPSCCDRWRDRCIVGLLAAGAFVRPAWAQDAPAATPPQVGASPHAVPIAFPAGQVPYPPYTLTRYDEDYAYLRDPAKRADPSDAFKYIALGSDPRTYLTLGGDARVRFDSYSGYPPDPSRREHGGYLLQRYMPYADLHVGETFRAFGQLISAWENGAHPAPVVRYQQTALDVDQLFGDVKVGIGDHASATLRLGRQELDYGAGRLIAPREGPNERQPFDAARLLVTVSKWRTDLIYARPVQLKDNAGAFDLHSSGREQLWGVYATRTGPLARLLAREGFDLYYLGYRRDSATFQAQPGRERRDTFGARLYGASPTWQYDLEVIAQSGHFGGQDIAAWAVSALVGRLAFARSALPIGLTLGADATSGDRRATDGELNTFNPLFPRAQYFTEAGFFGPTNLLSLHPGINIHSTKTVALALDSLVFWRESRQDAVYSPVLVPLLTKDNGAAYVATQIGVQLAWTPVRHVSVLVYGAHLFRGDYFASSSQRDADYVTASVNVHY